MARRSQRLLAICRRNPCSDDTWNAWGLSRLRWATRANCKSKKLGWWMYTTCMRTYALLAPSTPRISSLHNRANKQARIARSNSYCTRTPREISSRLPGEFVSYYIAASPPDRIAIWNVCRDMRTAQLSQPCPKAMGGSIEFISITRDRCLARGSCR
jgi:hypothetical protein